MLLHCYLLSHYIGAIAERKGCTKETLPKIRIKKGQNKLKSRLSM